MRQFLFFRFTGEIELAALQELARLRFEVGQLDAEYLVVLVHPFEPVRQPATARFEKDKTQLGKAIEHAFADDHRQSDHLLERVAEEMRVEKFVDALGARGVRAVTAQK